MQMSKPGKWGDHHVIDDRTGFKVLRSECRKEWNGLLVRKESWDKRHPQDNVRPKHDSQSVPDVRPETTDVFLEPGDVGVDDL